MEKKKSMVEKEEPRKDFRKRQGSQVSSQDFDFLFSHEQDDSKVLGLPIDSSLALSIGVVCVAERGISHQWLKKESAHALPKTFYAYPKTARKTTKQLIQACIDTDTANFKLQNYTVKTYTLGLPFEVQEITNISPGYNGKPKMMKADLNKVTSTDYKEKSEDKDKDCKPPKTEEPQQQEPVDSFGIPWRKLVRPKRTQI